MIRLAVRAPASAAEQVLAALLELSPGGVEERDGDRYVEYAIYGAPGEVPSLPRGTARVAGVEVTVTGEEVPNDWAERWRRFHGAVLIGGSVYVRPPWTEQAVRPGVTEVVIDPGQAFGTGAHPTTRLSLELLLDAEPRGSFVDLGCGSGVLAIAAAKLGFAPVTAVDADRGAIEATTINARANGVSLAAIELIDLRRAAPPIGRVVAANLMRPLLLGIARRLTAPPEALIVSGVLDAEADEVAAAFTSLAERRRLSERGWTALLLERSGGAA